MAKKDSKTKKTSKRTAPKRKASSTPKTGTSADDGRLLLLGKYTDVSDLIKNGTSDERITAAVFCNYPTENLNVEHLTNADLSTIAATFTNDEWITYGFHGAVHESMYEIFRKFQKAVSEFMKNTRILHAYVLAHKTARQTAVMLSDVVQLAGNPDDVTAAIKDGSPSLYDWNVSPDGLVTPDFKQDIGGGLTFAKILRDAADDVHESMKKAKTIYQALLLFRDRVESAVTIERKGALFFDGVVKLNLENLMRNYATFPEYGTAYLMEYAKEKGVNVSDLPAEMLERDYFPSWGNVTTEPAHVSSWEMYVYKIYSENIRDYANIVADATGLRRFKLGTFEYVGNDTPEQLLLL